MKNLTKFAAIATLLFTFLAGSTLTAQEWTKDQLDVWKKVDSMWAKWQANDIDGLADLIHENYLGWGNSSPMPESKAKWVGSRKKYSPMMSMQDYDIEPVRIHVERNTAVIHYYFSYSYMLDLDGEKKWVSQEGKWTAYMIMEKDLWQLIGDFTCTEDEDDD